MLRNDVRTAARRTAALAPLLLAGSAALAQSEPPHESPHHQPAASPAVDAAPGYSSVRDGLTIVQANVNAQGLNIVGDAANEPSLAVDPTAPNRIVIGWRQFDSIASNFREAGFAYSNNGGRSWTFPGVITNGEFRSDPVLETDAAGNFYYYTLPGSGSWRCEIFKSTDGGHTWAGPVLANGGDRAWFAIDKSGAMGDGHIYGIWNPSFSCCGAGSFGRDLSAATAPWPAPATLTGGIPIWGTCAVGPDGEVFVAGRLGGGFGVARSDTARNPGVGVTFMTTVPVSLGGAPSGSFGGPNPGGALGQTWVDVNRSSGSNRGHVYLLSLADPAGTDPMDIMFARSTDGGQTWSTPVRVNDDPAGATNWNWFPSMSVAPGGRIDATYAASFESGQVAINRVYYTYSTDEGQTWAPSVALTPSWNSNVGWPQQNKIGDYYDQESDDVGLFLAISATMNNEQDVYFVRVGDWDCNKNGIGDQQDLAAGTLHDCDNDDIPDECEIAAGAEPDLNQNGVPDPCEVCYADCNADGTLTVADFGCFQTRFVAGEPYADCNADGQRTVDDFGCFQTRFVQGCP